MSLKRITAPDEYLITLAEAKAHLRVDTVDDDTLIKSLIYAVHDYVEGPKGFLGRAIKEQTWDFFLDRFPARGVSWHYNGWCQSYGRSYVEVPLPPLISVTGVYYRDTSGVEQTFSPSNYSVDTASEPGRIYLPNSGVWPTVGIGDNNAVRIRFKAGYSDDDIPFAIKAAMLILIADLYENRESMLEGSVRSITTELPWSAQQLLKPHRMHRGFA